MGSAAMDHAGDIAIVTASSSNLFPAIRYTGRIPTDAQGTMRRKSAYSKELARRRGTACLGGRLFRPANRPERRLYLLVYKRVHTEQRLVQLGHFHRILQVQRLRAEPDADYDHALGHPRFLDVWEFGNLHGDGRAHERDRRTNRNSDRSAMRHEPWHRYAGRER